jgi:hypothetical protein
MAAVTRVDDVLYRAVSDDSVIVCENRSYSQPFLTIPATVAISGKLYSIQSIGPSAFHLNPSLQSLAFAANSRVSSIQARAFHGSSLTSLTLPPALEKLDRDTFRHTEKLFEVKVPRRSKSGFQSVGGVLYRGDELLFVPRNQIGVFEVGSKVRAICPWALNQCRQISGIRFAAPCIVESIDDGAFAETGIHTFTMPTSVEYLGASVFQGCTALHMIEFADSGVAELRAEVFRGTGIESFVIPQRVTAIGPLAFGETKSLRAVGYARGSVLMRICENAFWASSIERLELPPILTDLGGAQFFECNLLQTVAFPERSSHFVFEEGALWTTDESRWLLFCPRSVQTFTVPAQTAAIGGAAFANGAIAKVDFTSGSELMSIGAYAFFWTGLTSIDVPDSVVSIGEEAFGNCLLLTRVGFSERSHLRRLGSGAFRRSAIESFTGPNGLMSIGSSAFAFSSIRKAFFPERVSVIPVRAFAQCAQLELVTSTARRLTIEAYAFEGTRDACPVQAREIVVKTADWAVAGTAPSPEVLEQKAPRGMEFAALILNADDREPLPDFHPEKGAFGVVYKAKHRVTGAVSAIKEITCARPTDFWREAAILAKLHHPAVLGVIGFVLPENDGSSGCVARIVTEWLPEGSLAGVIKNGRELTPTEKTKIAVGIAKGMAYTHASNVWHRDLKPANILLDENFEVRISDFGTARLQDVTETLTRDVGTPLYMAPDTESTPMADVWAYGMIVWEVMTGISLEVEFRGKYHTGFGLMNQLKNGLRPNVETLGNEMKQLLEGCWHTEILGGSVDRPSFAEIVESFKGWNYALLDGVDVEAVKSYVEKIEEFELKFPPIPLAWDDDPNDPEDPD